MRRMRARGAGLVVAVLAATAVVPAALSAAPAGAAASTVAPFRSGDALVRQQFKDFQGRAATTAEVNPYLPALADGSKTAGQTIDEIAHLAGATDRIGNVTRLYTAYFQRLPDISGLEYWMGKSANGWTLNKISANFAGSSEFTRKYGSLTNAGFVDRAFQNVFGRAADPSGRTYWINKLNKGMSRGAVMVGFSQSNEYQRKQLPTVDAVVAYRAMLKRLPTAAEAPDAVALVTAEGLDALADQLLALPAYVARFPKPGSPTALFVHPGDAKAWIEWKAPSTNGVALAGYVLKVLKGGVQQGADRVLAADATFTTVTGLTNAQSYTFSISAFNASRDGAAVTSSAVTAKPEVAWSAYHGGPTHTGNQPLGTVPASPVKKWEATFSRPLEQVVTGDGRIFAITKGFAQSNTADADLYALDPADGAILWGPITIPKGSHSEMYLGYENGRVYAGNDEGIIKRIDSVTGAVLLTIDLDTRIFSQSGLTVSDGVIYTWTENVGLTAVTATTGAVRWRSATMNEFGTPAVDSTGVYAVQTCGWAFKFTHAGQSVWKKQTDCIGGGGFVSTLANGRLWGSGDDFSSLTPIRSQTDGATVGTPYGIESPAVNATHAIYNDGATLRGTNAATGALLWSKTGDGWLTGVPVLNAGRTYIASEHGRVYGYDAATGAVTWDHDVFFDVTGSPDWTDARMTGQLVVGDGLLLASVGIVGIPSTGSLIAYG